MLVDKFLSWKLKNTKEEINAETINALIEIEDISVQYSQLGYYAFMYRFTPTADIKSTTPDEIFKGLAENKSKWHKNAEKAVTDDIMLANLVNAGCKNSVLTFKKEYKGKFISDDGISDLMLLYQLFESTCKDKIYVREHYLRYGPQSYLYWFQQNIDLYSFNSGNAIAIKTRIKNLNIDTEMKIKELFTACVSLRQYLKDFMPLFQNNYLLVYIGLGSGAESAGISTRDTHAFFAGNFYGISVPIGYLKSIGM